MRGRELPEAVVASIAIRGASHQVAMPYTSSLKEIWRGVRTASSLPVPAAPSRPPKLLSVHMRLAFDKDWFMETILKPLVLDSVS